VQRITTGSENHQRVHEEQKIQEGTDDESKDGYELNRQHTSQNVILDWQCCAVGTALDLEFQQLLTYGLTILQKNKIHCYEDGYSERTRKQQTSGAGHQAFDCISTATLGCLKDV